ncbi:MAG TPA: ABC transporter permease [Lacunisphaera sp.]|nr:ABC transporter permease [Lacunisphaera sp.]
MFQQLRFACRSLLKTPGFTLVALVTLALGIGVNTSMYTLLDVLLFRSVPFKEADRLVSVLGTSPQGRRENFSFAELTEAGQQAVGPGKAFASLTTFAYWTNTWSDPGRPAERLLSIDATADFFDTFKVQPLLGRAYTAAEEVPGRNQVALLSYGTWQRRFGGDPAVIGRSVRLNAEQVTIIGVMPASFVAPLFFGPVDLWRPMTIPRFIVEDRNNRFFTAIARLNPGATPGQALAQLNPVAAHWAKDYPQTSKDRGFNLLPPHKTAMDDTSTFIIWLMFGLGFAVLLVACANLANLQLARATANIRDLAVRSALGASRGRLIWHQLVESFVLAVAGGILGVLVALWVNAVFGHAIRLGPDGDNTLALPMNLRVLAGAFLVSLGTGLLFGLLPAWFATRSDVVATLKQQTRSSTSGRGPRFMRQALIVGEVAVALALLGVAGIMIRGLDQLMRRDKGWDTGRLLAANIHLPEQSTYADTDKRRLALEKLDRHLAEISGAEHTALATSPGIFGYAKTTPIDVEGQPESDPNKLPTAGFTMVTRGYFATMGIPFLEGHDFPADLKADSPGVVIIGETMAKRLWPGQSALGRRIAEHNGGKLEWREVIGVVRDIQFALNITNPSTMLQVYKPMVHEPWGYQWLLLRAPNPGAFKNDLRRVVSDIDPDVAIEEIFTIPEAADRYQHNLVVINQTLAGFALLGLALAAVGLYGVISYLVAQRTSEFGIRLALGASTGAVLRLVMRSGLVLAVIGVAVGLAGAFALNRVVGSAMPLMAGNDPVTLLLTAAALLAVTVVSCWLPARRATRVDPIIALRAE